MISREIYIDKKENPIKYIPSLKKKDDEDWQKFLSRRKYDKDEKYE